ncbi:hypothetical protein E3Z27_12705 [Pseudomonas mediterranea]|jgi:hypothetical protein|uniref:Uncharacterized protein n=1 Tax=Pseudomonas mediterranea TaxID=183795 RepID=A0AAX2DEP5_9PSED|nr:hypothetical protein [Pseudomonas mediterranea]KGU82897.1 hypothetical protein N005_23060 [Pseudomonas mediterranea CFBP 5447]MDU9030748.1 hypothetical protein [Pseudomonas mediterranea]QHA82473.1 hypothetical protein E3Z27_12705 [Pseudomonas mediterranea]UZE03294.1 hypothetical protein LOY71_11940 [Pseudomonas mediterranea]CAH0238247.1 hypothetical protein SRABI112_02796 [Pseudomonas mediterranea]
MNDRQAIIKDLITAVVKARKSDEIVYQSEWLGYIPFGVYHWVECRGEDVSSDFPFGWSLEDLAGLEQMGFLETLEAYENPEDSFDREITYRVCVELT